MYIYRMLFLIITWVFVNCTSVLFYYMPCKVTVLYIFILKITIPWCERMCIVFVFCFFWDDVPLSKYFVSNVVMFHKKQSEKDKNVKWSQVFTLNDSSLTVTFLFPVNFLRSNHRKSKDAIHETEHCFLFSEFFYQNVCHDYQDNICHNLHELFWHLNYVVQSSIIRFSVNIDVYCSTCLSVLWNKTNVTQCTH